MCGCGWTGSLGARVYAMYIYVAVKDAQAIRVLGATLMAIKDRLISLVIVKSMSSARPRCDKRSKAVLCLLRRKAVTRCV